MYIYMNPSLFCEQQVYSLLFFQNNFSNLKGNDTDLVLK